MSELGEIDAEQNRKVLDDGYPIEYSIDMPTCKSTHSSCHLPMEGPMD